MGRKNNVSFLFPMQNYCCRISNLFHEVYQYVKQKKKTNIEYSTKIKTTCRSKWLRH